MEMEMVDEYTKICAEADIAEGEVRTFEVNRRPIAVAKYDGIIYAVDDICTHDGGDLGAGQVVKGQVQCPRHGARFDLKTGDATRMPAVFGIETHEVKIVGGEIYVAVPA
jgi:3-phenylpropionate/trans-cinnamate dioxygenase ferredoxin subunit